MALHEERLERMHLVILLTVYTAVKLKQASLMSRIMLLIVEFLVLYYVSPVLI